MSLSLSSLTTICVCKERFNTIPNYLEHFVNCIFHFIKFLASFSHSISATMLPIALHTKIK